MHKNKKKRKMEIKLVRAHRSGVLLKKKTLYAYAHAPIKLVQELLKGTLKKGDQHRTH